VKWWRVAGAVATAALVTVVLIVLGASDGALVTGALVTFLLSFLVRPLGQA